MKKIIASLFLLFSCFSAIASHIQGGEITYKCLGGNTYEVKLSYYWDCANGFNPGSSQTINVAGCSQSLTMPVFQSTLTPGNGVSASGLCPTASTLSYCENRIDYIGTITLPGACNSWTFSIGSCCRQGNIANVVSGSSASFYHYATLNNSLAPCNNSPDFIMNYIPVLCGNQPACINMGAVDNDEHILSYALIAAYQTQSTFVTYSSGYTGAVPITGITIDPNTGIINFTPTIMGDFLVVVQVTEKDAAGNVIGTIFRDFPITVTNCSNQTVCGQGSISNPSAGTVSSGSNTTLEICPNTPFCFDVIFTDPDVSDSVKITSPNLLTNLPGASIVTSYTPGVSNACKATVCWTAPTGSSNHNFILKTSDNACPVIGTQFVNYNIKVLSGTYAGHDYTLCGTQSASINAVGSSTIFAWSDLSGNPIPVSSEFSCNPCANPVMQPAITTTYVVTNMGAAIGCKHKDTLVVNVAPDFTITVNQSHINTVLNDTVSFSSTIMPAGSYSYTWSPFDGLLSTNGASTTATYSVGGTYNYTLTAANNMGCAMSQTATPLIVAQVPKPTFTITPTYTTSFPGGAVSYDIDFGAGSNPVSCGLSGSNCVNSNTIVVGTGAVTNGATTYPAIYGNFYKNTRHQILYLASELLAAGIQPGKISSLAFNVSQINGTAVYPNFTIKMKCTSVSDLSSIAFDQTGLTQVFHAPSVTITPGWNAYQFSAAYEWDGTSNILIDICNSFTQSYSQNSGTFYSITPFASIRWYNSDGTIACSTTAIANSYAPNNTYRPNIKFENCLSGPNPNEYSYVWTPSTGFNNPYIKNPTATVTGSQVYTVVVTPTAAVSYSAMGTATIDVIATSITGNISDNNISIYPNPTDGLLVVEILKDNEYPDEYGIEVTNALGEVVYMTKISKPNANLNLKHLNNGIYFVSVSNTSNVIAPYIKKIVIRR